MKPIIKFNGGAPIALCNRCFTIICYVSCTDEDGDDCNVLRPYGDDYSITIGGKVPIHCNKCKELLKYSLNE
jgi:hypothetical protein